MSLNKDDPMQSAIAPPRGDTIDFYQDLNKVTLVSGTSAVGKRGKGVGFYCEACNLTFKDSIQWIDHINSKQHLYNTTGSTDLDATNAKITVEDVKARLKYLKEKQERDLKESGMEFNLEQRIAQRQKFEQEEADRKRKKRIEKKKRQRESKKRKRDEPASEPNDMQAMMGFSGFGSTKN
ncbi:uncharacterized protein SAPINGB_P003398 [Magnusiomyces paraingens]|uniref:C2H2-type domain-containing protein n=1 Tax=Magnusiomyces paraingens TaxID=2606893 RepID=A0A5E8BRI4_9ASCO|nr:uncharacterized protein SAPINGB_P003398 [Saprochaete ingens]VVT53089.1 unnamed protein product [Saprochaete ingens]